jgi:hypothetical protein
MSVQKVVVEVFAQAGESVQECPEEASGSLYGASRVQIRFWRRVTLDWIFSLALSGQGRGRLCTDGLSTPSRPGLQVRLF